MNPFYVHCRTLQQRVRGRIPSESTLHYAKNPLETLLTELIMRLKAPLNDNVCPKLLRYCLTHKCNKKVTYICEWLKLYLWRYGGSASPRHYVWLSIVSLQGPLSLWHHISRYFRRACSSNVYNKVETTLSTQYNSLSQLVQLIKFLAKEKGLFCLGFVPAISLLLLMDLAETRRRTCPLNNCKNCV